ncbi:MAG: hypothetical protein ACRECQ_12880 [Burkholderiaceae bacterium]
MTTTKTRSGYQSADTATRVPPVNAPEHEERLLDQAIAESFPASDPISPAYESSLEPVLLENDRSREIWKRRLRKAAVPSLIALGSAAVIALVAAYLLLDQRSSWRSLGHLGDRLDDLRDHLPWRH